MLGNLLSRLKAVTGTIPDPMAERRRNRTGTVMKRADGRFRGRIQLGSKEDGTPDIRTVYGQTEDDAWKKLDALRDQHRNGELPAIEAGRLTLKEFLEKEWLPATKSTVKPTTYRSYEQMVRCHIVRLLGGTKLEKLSTRSIQLAVGKLADDGLSAQTILTFQRVLHRALQVAIKWGYLKVNPAAMVDTPTVPKIPRPVLSPEQIQRLLGDGSERDKLTLLYKTAIVTGARQGELLGLVWADFDPQRGTLRIHRSYYPKVGYQTPKTHKARTVPVPLSMADELSDLRARSPYARPDHPIFASSAGTPLDGPNVTKRFQARLREVGIKEPFRFHDLRHTHVTLLLRARVVPVAAVSATVGHYSPAVTHGLYDHASFDSGADAYRSAQEGLIGGYQN